MIWSFILNKGELLSHISRVYFHLNHDFTPREYRCKKKNPKNMGGKGSRQCYLDSKQEFCVYIPLNKKKKDYNV